MIMSYQWSVSLLGIGIVNKGGITLWLAQKWPTGGRATEVSGRPAAEVLSSWEEAKTCLTCGLCLNELTQTSCSNYLDLGTKPAQVLAGPCASSGTEYTVGDVFLVRALLTHGL